MTEATSLPSNLPSSLSWLSSLALTLAFVGGFYLLPDARSGHLPRSHPTIIKRRFFVISVVCSVGFSYLWFLLRIYNDKTPLLTLVHHFFPLPSPTKVLLAILLPIIHVSLLFLGPLTSQYLSSSLPFQSNSSVDLFLYRLQTLQGVRNYAVGPISEELVFRGYIGFLSYWNHITHGRDGGDTHIGYVLLNCMMWFGIAHLHHAWEIWMQEGKDWHALKLAVAVTSFQFLYTSLFGAYAAFLFLRTGSLIPPILVHIFCNIMGFPDFSEIRQHTHPKVVATAYILGVTLFISFFNMITDPHLFAFDVVYWRHIE